jgi:hypothetical protein
LKPHSSSPKADRLVEALASGNVAEMATGLASDPQVRRIWNAHPAAELYSSVVEDTERPEPVRFAAALVLRSMSAEQFQKTEPAAIAQAFAAGLQQDLAGYAFPWGWLWDGDDELGLLGKNFLALGAAAIPALEALLGDPTLRNTYLGSDEASLMAIRRYRVKDFAAFYLSRITGIELPWEPNLAQRDAAIARLRQQLPR